MKTYTLDQLTSFLQRAKKSTFASGRKVPRASDTSKTYDYQEGNLLYKEKHLVLHYDLRISLVMNSPRL